MVAIVGIGTGGALKAGVFEDLLYGVLDLFDGGDARLDKLVASGLKLSGELFGTLVVKFAGSLAGFGHGVDNLLELKVNDFAVALDDFFEHKKYLFFYLSSSMVFARHHI